MAIRNVFEHVNALSESIENLDVEALKADLESDQEVLLIDIREVQETVLLGGIPGAIHVPRGMLEFWADPASPYARDYFGEDKRTVVFCAGGGRSVYAVKALEEMGFSNVAHLAGGFTAWKEAGEEIEDIAAKSKWVKRD
ncbi:MAG: rhodanese [Pseudohongiella sp.]|nr:MAG: rhodanese [Pseudohongiella sp.]